MGFSWRKTFKIKQTRKSKCLSAFDGEHAQCLTGYHVFMVSGLDLARAPRRAPLTARKKGSGYENVTCTITSSLTFELFTYFEGHVVFMIIFSFSHVIKFQWFHSYSCVYSSFDKL